MNKQMSLLTGIAVGVGLQYFLDPGRGGRRRALMRDSLIHGTAVGRRAGRKTARDLRNRLYGTAAAIRGTLSHETSADDVLAARVRSAIGRVLSHPHALEVTACDGVVTLRGPVLAAEAPNLVKTVEGVKGVSEVVEEFQTFKQAGNIPSLQGGAGRKPEPRLDLLQSRWAPATRLMVGGVGTAAAVYGLSRRDWPGSMLAVGGALLAAQAASNLECARFVGIGAGRRAVDVQKTMIINAPIDEVFSFWAAYENFPHFMAGVREVRPSRLPGLSHWTVTGPGGTAVEFDAELVVQEENRYLAWRTVAGSFIEHSGLVRFDPVGDGASTRVSVRMSYNPPGGWLGHQVARMFGVDPKHTLDADLVRAKTLLETGRAARDAAQPDPDLLEPSATAENRDAPYPM